MHKQSNHIQLKTLALICISTLALLLVACKKDTKTQDPCVGKTEANADFTIYEKVGDVAIEADTVWINSSLILQPKYRQGTSFKFTVRTQGASFSPQMQDSTATSFFYTIYPAIPTAQFYTVTCIATKNVDGCTHVKNIDSLKKVFYMWPKQFPNEDYVTNPPSTYKYLPIFGTYKGYKNSNPSQLIYVTLFDTIIQPQHFNYCESGGLIVVNNKDNLIRNLAYNNYSTENTSLSNSNNIHYIGASGIVFNSIDTYVVFNPPCYSSKYYIGYHGVAWSDFYNSKKIYINYSFNDTLTNNLVNDFFTGYKVN